MLREGPIPRPVHGIIEYLAGALFIVAPFLLSFDSGAAKAASIVVGVVILIVAACTAGPTGLISSVPIPAHVVLDYILAVALIAAPFLLGFSGETAPTALFIVMGVAHFLITIGTRFEHGQASRATRTPS
ncbi:hypothetical protein BH20ACT18_BH20ACT18_07130 [soil metagenome]